MKNNRSKSAKRKSAARPQAPADPRASQQSRARGPTLFPGVMP